MFKRFFSKSAPDPTLVVEEASVALEGGRIDDAVRSLDRLLAAMPTHVEARSLRGGAHLTAGRAAAALPDLAYASVLAPQDPRHHYNLALAYLQINNMTEALC